MRIPVFPGSLTECCGMSSRVREYCNRGSMCHGTGESWRRGLERWETGRSSCNLLYPALALDPSIPNAVLMKWGSIMLIRGSAGEVSTAATKFNVPRFVVCRVICDILERHGRVMETVEYFQQMQNELPDAGVRNERAEWELNVEGEELGDNTSDSKKHDEAIGYYSNALSLDPTNNDILLKQTQFRRKACLRIRVKVG
ncbi:hypothetical protein HD554DRAFT_2074278 [Boletus coccyginus]|nr:hypothetical protein HD554DRAFT_2074278 [Boletus coccyginus]